MANNNLYTKSYFKKRLRDVGLSVSDMVDSYAPEDTRYWTILIDGGRTNIECTCVREDHQTSFTMIYPNQAKVTIKTQSMGVILENIAMVVDKWRGDDADSAVG